MIEVQKNRLLYQINMSVRMFIRQIFKIPEYMFLYIQLANQDNILKMIFIRTLYFIHYISILLC